MRTRSLAVVIAPGKLIDEESRSLMLWSERVLIALPEDHRLADQEAIYWTDLRRETLLMTRHDPYWEFEDLLTSKLPSADDRRCAGGEERDIH